jgi:23S rRNA (cytosine1962-C5)-methyltransferase
MSPIYLKKREERRIKAGHLWVFSNEIDTARSPIKGSQAGSQVTVHASNGEQLGWGYLNSASLISVRLLQRGRNNTASVSELFSQRLSAALAWRESCFDQPYYRLVHSEGDYMPGVVIDRFGDYLVVQISTAGMEALKTELVNALQVLLSPRGILIRNDARGRALEGLEVGEPELLGGWPKELDVYEGDCHFQLPADGGQKTGWFYDQRPNREAFLRWAPGKRVLDVFSYIGGWGIQAAKAGAESVTCIDGSQSVCDQITANAALNKVDVDVICKDAFKALSALKADGRMFDSIVVDPPALIQKKKDQKNGTQAYQRLNELALDCLAPGGVLVSASCSHHLAASELHSLVRRAANKRGKEASVIAKSGAGLDHPVHPAIPETEYLKAVFSKIQ